MFLDYEKTEYYAQCLNSATGMEFVLSLSTFPPISLGALTSPWHYFFRKGFLKEVFMLLLVLLLRVQLSSPSSLFCPQPALAGRMRTPTPRLREDYGSRGLGS